MQTPRNLEALMKKAAVDPGFREALLARRSRLAEEINVPLDAAEKQMLDGASADHLALLIEKTPVPPAEQEILTQPEYEEKTGSSGVGPLAVAGVSVLALLAYFAAGSSTATMFQSITSTLGHTTQLVSAPSPGLKYSAALKKTLNIELCGKPIREAREILQREAGIRVVLHASPGAPPDDAAFPATTAGLTVHQALTAFGRELGRAFSLKYSLEYLPDEIRVSLTR
jgi:hypothetical protein